MGKANEGRRRAATPRVERAPGWYTELIRKHDWPPNFVPQLARIDDWRCGPQASRRVSAQREAGLAAGQVWARGTVDLPGTRVNQPKPAWMSWAPGKG